MGTVARLLLVFMILTGLLRLGSCDTDPQDAAALRSMLSEWKNAPPTWGQSSDPCGMPWEGVFCDASRVTSLIPASLGLLSNLYWLDLADNQLIGSLPISVNETPGLDLLLNTKHFSSAENTKSYCLLQQQAETSYSTSLAKCGGSTSCSSEQKLNPRSCSCAYPYQGLMVFRAPSFRDLTNATLFQELETSLRTKLGLAPSSVYISDLFFNSDNYIQLNLALFPSSGIKRLKELLNRADLSVMSLSQQEIVNKMMVYRGILSSGQMVAIKRAQQGSMQGALEFKTEIELLSRVHHKNLVDLVGFCFEQGEQMLVYEYIPNGTLRENLTGRSGRQLDWKKRLRIALGSARGLAYLHELADPPIIHRDVKSTNILVDESLNAKGYLDPEYYMTQQLSEKSDVYSFGVVLLELITARQPIEKGKYIVREIRNAVDNYDEEYYGLREMMDPVIRDVGNLTGLRSFVRLAIRCVEESAADRPTMNEVVKEIETILQSNGLNTQPSSASSSVTDFGKAQGAPRHPYHDNMKSRNEESSSAFEYSGAYSARIEPK
ncbi:hypothetical protein BHE74_00045272 [Ensete ventricosum]|nr:hypothetical protein GW17_00030727 [Ensete ventricosum]RWW48637.1 hypothetical protein BHE74_00045272 [Ensete ventricosum]